jgi:hypothetical protein
MDLCGMYRKTAFHPGIAIFGSIHTRRLVHRLSIENRPKDPIFRHRPIAADDPFRGQNWIGRCHRNFVALLVGVAACVPGRSRF